MSVDLELIKTVAAVVGPLVAAVAVALTYYMFRRNMRLQEEVRRETAPLAKRERLRDPLAKLVAKLDTSRIIIENPSDDDWANGFASLRALRDLCGECVTEFKSSDLSPIWFDQTLEELRDRTLAVLVFESGFNEIRNGRPYVPREEYARWTEFPLALAAFRLLQEHVRGNLGAWKWYLGDLMTDKRR